MLWWFFKKYKWLFCLALILIAIYLYSMVYVPLSVGDWAYTLQVWDRWQSFNAAMIALLSGLIFFTTSRIIEHKNQINRARAARAFLPHQLSYISQRCDSNIKRLLPIMQYLECDNGKEGHVPENAPLYSLKSFGADYFPFFRDSIEVDDIELGQALSKLLRDIQIAETRLASLKEDLQTSGSMTISARDVYSKILHLVEIKARNSKIFDYARDKKQTFTNSALKREDIYNAAQTVDASLLSDNAALEHAISNKYPSNG